MPDLREQLAARLIACSLNYLRSEDAVALADEVIRQMQWARRSCKDYVINDGWGDIPMKQDLTAAPNDWKPAEDS